LERCAQDIERVVLIGPPHYVPFRGIAVPTVEAFDTPLGRAPLDRGALAATAELPSVRVADAPHAPEHALEVELPFLQALLPSWLFPGSGVLSGRKDGRGGKMLGW
jgi:AmmeMemoRadiSam system protein B